MYKLEDIRSKSMPKAMQYTKGSIIYFEGDHDERIFIMQSGSVLLTSSVITPSQYFLLIVFELPPGNLIILDCVPVVWYTCSLIFLKFSIHVSAD